MGKFTEERRYDSDDDGGHNHEMTCKQILALVHMRSMDMYVGIFGLLHNLYAFGRPSESLLPTIEAFLCRSRKIKM